MNGLVQAIILAVVISACALGVVIGITKTIGIEYRKNSKYASDAVGKALAEIPNVAKETMAVIDQYQEEQKDKAARKAWEEQKKTQSTMSLKDEPGWGIM